MALWDEKKAAKKRLGDTLVEGHIITPDQLESALDRQKETGEKLGDALVGLGYVTERQIIEGLHRQLGLKMIDLSTVTIPPDIIDMIPDIAVLKKYLIVPYGYKSENKKGLYLAMSNPLDLNAVDDIIYLTAISDVEPVIASKPDILAAIDKYFGRQEAETTAREYEKENGAGEEQETGTVNNENVDNAPIVRIVKRIIEKAVRFRASDIHIEPMEERIRVRNRIDGVLQETESHPAHMLSAMVARVKVISGMNIAEKRKPQDGRFTQTVDNEDYDIRVSTLPTIHGEKVVMRLASKNKLLKGKKELGMTDEDLEKFNRILKHSHGMILVTGPTGSGKSTTMYTAINEINKPGINVITVEDPVEAEIEGINQVQINPKAELDFASALRSILRQDPDVIMVGEIRDRETANIAVSASITGHLVISTLHTNNAASTIARLKDMGVEPYMIAESAVGIISQRLLRCLCRNCRVSHKATLEEKRILEIPDDAEQIVWEAPKTHDVMCPKCNGTGYIGRTGVYEIMQITPELQERIAGGEHASQLQEAAVANGMKTIKEEAVSKVLDGTTSLDELYRVIYEN